MSILITVNLRLGHGSAFWSLWTHSELIKSSRWADFFLMGNNENDFISDQRICYWQCNWKLFFKLKCMFLNLIYFDLWSCHSIPRMFSIFIFSFIKFWLMDMILCSHVCATYTWHDTLACDTITVNKKILSCEQWALLCHIAKYKWICDPFTFLTQRKSRFRLLT